MLFLSKAHKCTPVVPHGTAGRKTAIFACALALCISSRLRLAISQTCSSRRAAASLPARRKNVFFVTCTPQIPLSLSNLAIFLSLSTIGTRIIGVPPGFFAHFPTAFFGVLRALLRTSRLPCGELCCAPRRPDAFFVFFWCPRWSAPSNYETAKT